MRFGSRPRADIGNSNGHQDQDQNASQGPGAKFLHPHPAADFGVILWPADGGQGLLTTGRTTIDLVEGTITRSDGASENLSTSLRALGLPHMHSLHFHPFFSSMSVQLLYPTSPRIPGVDIDAPADIARVARIPPFWLDAQHHFITHAAFRRVELITTHAVAAFCEFGPSPESPPVVPLGIGSPNLHHFSGTSTNAFVALTPRPSAHNPATNTTTVMSIADAEFGNDNPERLNTIFTSEVIWTIRNTHDTNDVDVNIQIANTGAPGGFIDDPDTTAASATIAAGASVVYRCQHQSLFKQLRIKSTVDDAAATVSAEAIYLLGY